MRRSESCRISKEKNLCFQPVLQSFVHHNLTIVNCFVLERSMRTLSETLSLRFEFMQPTCTQFFQLKWPKKKLALAVIFYMQPIPLHWSIHSLERKSWMFSRIPALFMFS